LKGSHNHSLPVCPWLLLATKPEIFSVWLFIGSEWMFINRDDVGRKEQLPAVVTAIQ
jgi:hypothetical protein